MYMCKGVMKSTIFTVLLRVYKKVAQKTQFEVLQY